MGRTLAYNSGSCRRTTELSDRERGRLFVGIRAIARLGGPDVAAKIWDTIEAKRK